MDGEKFLNKLYKDLNLSDEVMHTSAGSKNKDEAVKRYLDRLERVQERAVSKGHLDMIKKLYHQKYVINENDIPNGIDKERIIQIQKESLDKWLDYLLDETARYPMWAKYWAFQGMLKIGTYNEATNTYQRRSKATLAPFIEVNPEILAKCIGFIVTYVKDKKLSDTALDKLIESGNFQKLYTLLIKNVKEKSNYNSDKEDGIWLTYYHESEEEADTKEQKGIEPEYLKLYNSLQGYNTGWCTAGDKITAKDQVCGVRNYEGGNFYVYYTKNEAGEYKIPRIAIRMEGDLVGEIRGIDPSQNVEEGMENVVEKKLHELDLLDEDISKYQNIISNMRKLTELNKKQKNNIEFTFDDLVFIYELDENIKGFGYEADKRISTIKEQRDIKKDFMTVFLNPKCLEYSNNLGYVFDEYHTYIPSNTKYYPQLVQLAVQQYGYALQYVPATTKDYEEIVKLAVQQNGWALEYVPATTKDYEEIVKLAVQQYGWALEYVPTTIEGYEEIVKLVVQQCGWALQYVPTTIEGYEEISKLAVQQTGYALKYVPVTTKGYEEIAKLAVQQTGYALRHIPATIEGYEEISKLAVQQNGQVLEIVPTTTKGYEEIAKLAVQQDGSSLQYVPTTTKGYEEIVKLAVQQNGWVLDIVSTAIEGYEELQEIARSQNIVESNSPKK